MKPYFYIIQFMPTKQYYAGCRYSKDIRPNEFMKEDGYVTSSQIVHELINKHGIDAFVIKTQKLFDSKESVMAYERRFLKKVDAKRNSKFLNQSNGNTPGFGEGDNNIMSNLEIREKAQSNMRISMMKNHGVDHNFKLPGHKEKRDLSLIKKYGTTNLNLIPGVADKIVEKNRKPVTYVDEQNPQFNGNYPSIKAVMDITGRSTTYVRKRITYLEK